MAIPGIRNVAWGKTIKGFASYLNIAGQTIGPKVARDLADAAQEFMENEDWDWPRGQRYDAIHPSGRAVRGAMPYASGYRGGDNMHPWYSGNLHDSIAVAVMRGSRILAKRHMRPGASEYQEYKGAIVDGPEEGEKALVRASHTFAPGQSGNTLRAVMVVGVPYADYINSSPTIGWDKKKTNPHQGYVEYLEHEFYTTILPKMEQIRKIKLKLK